MIVLPVSPHEPDAQGSMKLLVDFFAVLICPPISGETVSRDHDHIGLLGSENCEHPALAPPDPVGVKVGQLRDLQRGADRTSNLVMSGLDAVRLDKHCIDRQTE
jgi:hypothetical protein